MNDNNKEIRRIRLEDLDVSLQNILLKRISKDDPTWKKLQDLIDDLYKKTNIEKKKINVTITNQDPANQTIRVYIGSKLYTENFTCYNTDRYKIVITPNTFLKAGNCNVPLTGYFREDTDVIVGKTSLIKDSQEDPNKPTYSIRIKIGYNSAVGTYGFNETYIWDPSTLGDKTGEANPDNIIDILWMTSAESSYYAFYGGVSVSGLFNTFSSTIISPKGERYVIADKVPNSQFNSHGDLSNTPLLTTEKMFNLFKSWVGEWITVEIYLT